MSTSSSNAFSSPVPNASLLLSFRPIGRKVLIIGAKKLAASRIFSILEADAVPIIVDTDSQGSEINEEVQWRISQGQCKCLQAPPHDTREAWQELIESVDKDDTELFAVCITDTLHLGDVKCTADDKSHRQSPLERAKMIQSICKAKRIPINVADQPLLCDFSFPATHRFQSNNFSPLEANGHVLQPLSGNSSLQIAVTTNGKGCRLAGRIRREIVSKLPRNVGDAVERIGEMREIAKRKGQNVNTTSNEDGRTSASKEQRSKSLRRSVITRKSSTTVDGLASIGVEEVIEDDLSFDNTPLNSPVPQLSSPKSEGFFAQVNERLQSEQVEDVERKRRMRWVAQMSEYWPIEYLGSLNAADMAKALDTYVDEKGITHSNGGIETPRGRLRSGDELQNGSPSLSRRASSQHSLTLDRPKAANVQSGHIFLVGSGTGHPGLLTTFAHNLLTSSDTDLILSDKLVPSSILSLIPKSTPLKIARKFPGNAEGAQSELISLALEGALEGKRVIRLKQGDPFVYGRGGEEILAFKKANIETTVVPGISSALAAPLMLGIPVTQRGAADSLTLCTGVGRGGKSVRLPGYERSRSLIVLMGVARLKDVVKTLCHDWQSSIPSDQQQSSNELEQIPAGIRSGAPFPPYTPIAIIERASSSDQRLIASTLSGIESAMTRIGEQRPPGMMLIGWAALSLDGTNGNVDILDDEDQCGEDFAKLERRDRKKVQMWLGESNSIVKEGLDDFYSNYHNIWDAKLTQPLNRMKDGIDEIMLTHADVQGKGASGWAPPRYGKDGPAGGWGHEEKPL